MNVSMCTKKGYIKTIKDRLLARPAETPTTQRRWGGCCELMSTIPKSIPLPVGLILTLSFCPISAATLAFKVRTAGYATGCLTTLTDAACKKITAPTPLPNLPDKSPAWVIGVIDGLAMPTLVGLTLYCLLSVVLHPADRKQKCLIIGLLLATSLLWGLLEESSLYLIHRHGLETGQHDAWQTFNSNEANCSDILSTALAWCTQFPLTTATITEAETSYHHALGTHLVPGFAWLFMLFGALRTRWKYDSFVAASALELALNRVVSSSSSVAMTETGAGAAAPRAQSPHRTYGTI